MMQPTAYHESQSGLGLCPGRGEARVDAGVIMFGAAATSDRSARYRTAGIGRGGYAP